MCKCVNVLNKRNKLVKFIINNHSIKSTKNNQTNFEEKSAVADGVGHRSGVVHRGFYGNQAGVWHEPVGWLQSHYARPRGRDANRAALVSAYRHVSLASLNLDILK